MDQENALHLLDCCWGPRARSSEEAHYFVATAFTKWNQVFSISIVILAGLSGSGLVSSLAADSKAFRNVLAAMSLFTALIAAVQRSLQYAKRSVEHQGAGADWGPIVNSIEELRAELNGGGRPPADEAIDGLRTAMDNVTKKSPQIPQRIFRRFKIGETYLYGKDHECPQA
jgi:SMODS and SLOG-associating 2TM effector domain family 4